MEKSYRLVSLFFVCILLVLFWGFYRTYFMFFPGFKGFKTTQHFHGLLMLTWMVMLIVQPLLIASGRTALHKMIGKLSYVIAPLMMISIFMVLKMAYFSALEKMGKEPALGGISLQLPGLITFAIFYGLAIWNKNRTAYHMRYMIGTGLLMIGPGLGRALIIYFGQPFPMGVTLSDYFIIALAALLLVIDLVRKGPWVPYTIVLTLSVISHFLFANQMSPWWQSFATWFSGAFF
jgi:hypothetical protein